MEKIIHQIWVGPFKIPEKEYNFSLKIKETHPDFDYMFWTDENIPTLPFYLQNLKNHYAKTHKWVNIADLLRCWVIFYYGGTYIDLDYEMYNSLHDIELENYDGFIPLHFNPSETICNSIFGFKKHHFIMKYIIDEMQTIQFTNDWLGPTFFGRCIKESIGYTDDALDVDICSTLKNHNIHVMHSRNEFQKKYMKHHLSYNWSEENQKKLLRI